MQSGPDPQCCRCWEAGPEKGMDQPYREIHTLPERLSRLSGGQPAHQLNRRRAELRRASNRSRTPAWISLWFRNRYPDWAASISFNALATSTQRTHALPRSASSCASAAVIGVSNASETVSPKAKRARSQRSVWAL